MRALCITATDRIKVMEPVFTGVGRDSTEFRIACLSGVGGRGWMALRNVGGYKFRSVGSSPLFARASSSQAVMFPMRAGAATFSFLAI